MLATSPVDRLRGMARLTKLPLDPKVTEEDCCIYTIVGPCLPYIGQVGYIQGF